MKYIFLLLTLLSFTLAEDDLGTLIFEADYSNFFTQFTKWQSQDDTSVPKVITEDDKQVLYFDGEPTHYSGYVSESITSPNGKCYITLEYKGENDIRSGGYLAYVRSDQPNIQRTLGLDANINMEFSQIFRFEDNGDWKTYLAYVEVPVGVSIQLILEKGSYFGITKHDAKFRNLKVYDFDLCSGDCPAENEQLKVMQLGYYSFVFFNNELQYQIFGDVELSDGDSSQATFTMKYPHNPICCVKPSFYMLDSDGKVVEDFQPTYSAKSDLEWDESLINDKWVKSFTMSEAENWGCVATETTNKDEEAAILYTCDIQMHFYYDYGQNFASKQEEYDYSKNNSQGIFKSQFFIIIHKDTKTCFNSFIKTLEIDAICTGICQLDMSLSLDLYYKLNSNDAYQPADPTTTTPVTLTWGEYVYFQIKSTPSDYDLELMKVVIETEGGVVPFGSMFISSFIQNQDTSKEGELTFEMMIGGEAGLTKGKKFNLQFLTESNAAERRLLENESNLPSAQVSNTQAFQAGESEVDEDEDDNTTKKEDNDEDENEEIYAGRLSFGFLTILLLFVL